MGDRAVYCARLESVCAERHRGFESPPIRQLTLAQRSGIGFLRNVRSLLFTLFVIAAARLLSAEEKFSDMAADLAMAKQQYLGGHFDEAIATLDRAEGKSSRTVESQDLRGCVYLEQGKLVDAEKAFESAHAIKYESFSPRIHHADALLPQKKFADAGNEYEKLIDTKAPMGPDYAKFGVLLAYLGQHDDPLAKRVFDTILFPTETPAYYYAQSAWAFAHGNNSEAQKWMKSARKIFDAKTTAWFDRVFFQFGWIKKKPAPTLDPFWS